MPTSPSNTSRTSRDLFAGIDGGGTKTHAVICDSRGKVLSEDRAGPSNPMRVGMREATREILAALVRACDKLNRTPDEIVSLTAGLAGVRRADLKLQMQASLASELPVPRINIFTDAEIALFATTAGKPGAVVISGTGSVCFGKNGNGESAVSGGWGPIAGDEGGGVSIARKALQAVARASDGRGPATRLSKLAADYFRAATPEDLIVAIYSPHTDYTKVAGFAASVIKAARAGDLVAAAIMDDAGHELGVSVCAVLKRLKLSRKKIRVGTVGGIFNAGELLTGALAAEIRKCSVLAELAKPSFTPGHAAALMAIDEHKGVNGSWLP